MASGPHTLPITGNALRSSARVRSPLSGFQLSPRSSLRYSRWDAVYSRVRENGEMMIGVSQFQRLGASPRPTSGRMPMASPVRTSKRTMPPPWLSAYIVFGSSGSMRDTKPSPPLVTNQSVLRMPLLLRVAAGPHSELLSCVPPQTR